MKRTSFSNILLLFTIIYAEFSWVHLVYVMQMLDNSRPLYISSQFHGHCPHIEGLKSAMQGGFSPWELANATNRVLIYCLVDF